LPQGHSPTKQAFLAADEHELNHPKSAVFQLLIDC